MKKALVILMALSMVFAAFADEPAVKNEIAEFTGNASVTWGVDLDAGKTGFKNDASGSFKFTLIGGGDKSTTGDGVWGELKIKIDDIQYTGMGAWTIDFTAGTITQPWGTKAVSIETAKIHLNDMIAIGIKEGSNKYGEYKPVTAVKSDCHYATGNVGGNVTDGITVEVAVPDLIDFNIDFRSVEQYTNQYGIGTSLAVKAVENLNLKVGFGIDFYNNNPWGLSASADYKLGLSDTMYLKPQVGFTMTNADNSGELTTALLVGWGKENQDTNIKFISKKVSDGFSVATKIAFADNSPIPLCVGLWDSTFVENLKFGAQFHVNNLKDFALNTLGFEFAYDLGGIKPAFGFAMDKGGDLGWTDDLKIAFSVDFTGFVDNTTFTLAYNSGNLKASAGEKLGKIDLTAKISF